MNWMGSYTGRPRAEFGGWHRKGLDCFAEKKKMGVICVGVWEREKRSKARDLCLGPSAAETAKEAGGEGIRLLLENLLSMVA